MRTLLKIVLWLIVLTIALDIAWPQEARERAAGAIAHSICSQPSRPRACDSTGRTLVPVGQQRVGRS